MTRKRWQAGPGDGGPCPICGEDMAETVYEERQPMFLEGRLVVEVNHCRGRYWHMRHAHRIMEDYFPTQLPEATV